jgi:hypothetical protein
MTREMTRDRARIDAALAPARVAPSVARAVDRVIFVALESTPRASIAASSTREAHDGSKSRDDSCARATRRGRGRCA